MKVQCRVEKLRLDIPFTISRGTTTVQEICIAEIAHGGLIGYGEASPSAYYGDSVEKARRAITGSEQIIGEDVYALESIARDLASHFPESPSGRAAVEMAAYDLAGKSAGLPVHALLGLSGLEPPRTSYTVGVKDPTLIGDRLRFLRSFPILKVKLGFGREEDLLKLLRDETQAVLRADVNEGWSLESALEKMPRYRDEYSIEFFEQPLPKADLAGYRRLMAESSSTVIVDESVTCAEDIIKWAGLCHGVNLKLMKSGGIGESLKMIRAARAAGLRVMLGCMVESSLGITAAAQIAPLVDYCDLDGNLLIANDPFDGVKGLGGRLELSTHAGLGANPRT